MLQTKYLGLNLRNPLIVGSCGITNHTDNLKKIEDSNAGAVVLKSIFEEQIRHETENLIHSGGHTLSAMDKGFNDIMQSRAYEYSEAMQYITDFAKEHTLKEYLGFISAAKKAVNIPVIASVNCVFTYDWYSFARRIQEAGADAIELNIYLLPSDPHKKGAEIENLYLQIIQAVKQYVSIPVSVKIGYYFSGLSQKVIELSESVSGMVLFNRPYTPDIDIDKLSLTGGQMLSGPADYGHTLRWVALLAGRVKCDISAATGIHNGEAMIKQLLAGATTVQVASVLYKNGIAHLATMISELETWMKKHHFSSIDDFRGKMSQINHAHPADYERVQFMKLYSQIE